MPKQKLPFPQQGSNTLLGFFQKSGGIVFNISSTNFTGVLTSPLSRFSSSIGIKYCSIDSRLFGCGEL